MGKKSALGHEILRLIRRLMSMTLHVLGDTKIFGHTPNLPPFVLLVRTFPEGGERERGGGDLKLSDRASLREAQGNSDIPATLVSWGFCVFICVVGMGEEGHQSPLSTAGMSSWHIPHIEAVIIEQHC